MARKGYKIVVHVVWRISSGLIKHVIKNMRMVDLTMEMPLNQVKWKKMILVANTKNI